MSKTDALKQRPEAFAEATKFGLSPINSTTLLTCTVVSAVLSLYAELPGTRSPRTVGYLAIAAWLAGLTLTLFLAGRSTGAVGLRTCVTRGAVMARGNLRFTCVVLLLMGGAALTTWSRVSSERSAKAGLRELQMDASVIRAAVTRDVPPAEALARLGFTSSFDDVCRAFNTGNSAALTLIAKTGVKSASVSQPLGAGQYALCIEPLLLAAEQGRDIKSMLAILPIAPPDLSRLHVSQQLGVLDSGPISLPPLIKAAGAGADKKARLMHVFASPLMFAVWADNAYATQALLKAGADPNQGARLGVMPANDVLNNYSLTVTPLAEARRLDRTSVVDALMAAGARSRVEKGDYF